MSSRPLKFKLSDTTLTSDVNQTLSNLLSQSNKNKKTIKVVQAQTYANTVRSVNPVLALEGLSDVVIKAVQNGQTIVWNGTDWVNGTSGPTFNTSGQGWFVGAGMSEASAAFVNTSLAQVSNFSANQVIVFQFVLHATWTLSKVAYLLTTTAASTHFSFGIYSAAGNKLIDSGQFDGSLSTLQVNSFTSVILQPGVYYLAVSATSSTPSGPSMQSTNIVTMLKMLNGGAGAIVASAANSTSGGVMPATLGTLTAITSAASWQGIPLMVWLV